jgi:hypothetical protein
MDVGVSACQKISDIPLFPVYRGNGGVFKDTPADGLQTGQSVP